MTRLALLAILALSLRAQEFDAASIRPPNLKAPSHCTGGPATDDPGLLTCQNFSLANLVMMAYNVRPYQFTAPDWMKSTRFDVHANVPPGTTFAQFRVMQQNLLASRFKLIVHRDKKEMDGYDLVVMKKSPNLKEAGAEPTSRGEVPWYPPAGSPPVRTKAQFNGMKTSMPLLAEMLSDELGKPVTDATGLKGRYDFKLQYTRDPAGPGPAATDDAGITIESALTDQLGLALVKKKVQVDTVTVDHSEKSPTDN